MNMRSSWLCCVLADEEISKLKSSVPGEAGPSSAQVGDANFPEDSAEKLTPRPRLFLCLKRRWNKVHRISIIYKKWFTNISVRDWRRGQGSTYHLSNSQGAARKFHWQRHLPWGTRLPLMRSWKSKSKHIPVSFFCHTFVYTTSNIFSFPPHTGRSWLISVYSAHLMTVIWSLFLLMIKMEILLFLISLCTVFVMMMLSIRKILWDIGCFSRPGSLWVFIWLPLHSPPRDFTC